MTKKQYPPLGSPYADNKSKFIVAEIRSINGDCTYLCRRNAARGGRGRARGGAGRRGAAVITVVAFGLTAELNNRLHCGAREQRVGAIKVSFGDSIGRQTRLALRGPRNARAATAGGAVSGPTFVVL